jgi:hypothetical protein
VRFLFVAAALVAPASARVSRAAEPFSGELSLVLSKAMYLERGQESSTPHLILELKANAGQWDRAWGIALGYNNSVGYGLVRKAVVDANAVLLDVEMKQDHDIWTRGARGRYTVELSRDAGGKLHGKYEGEFNGRKMSGAAHGELRPPRPIAVKDYRPVEYGEHPRLLFRKSDLPRLKERLQTPLGAAYLQQARQWKPGKANEAGDLVSLGMLYQLTGDKSCAEEAMKIIEGFKGDVDPNPSGSGSAGHRFVQTAICFDLCCEAWPAEFRQQVTADLSRFRSVVGFDVAWVAAAWPIIPEQYKPFLLCGHRADPVPGSPPRLSWSDRPRSCRS